MDEKKLRELLGRGWVHARMFFEVMGGSEEVAKTALRKHLDTVKKMENMKIVSEKIGEAEKVENPPRQLKEAFSQIAEVDVAVSSFENLLYSIIFFGPSSTEIVEPKEFKIGVTSAQSMLNAVAEIMHRYAAGGAGGIVISTKK